MVATCRGPRRSWAGGTHHLLQSFRFTDAMNFDAISSFGLSRRALL
jgi:hypothetical protein